MFKSIEELQNYALTGNVSRYNEDSLTAQQLMIATTKKARECLQTLVNIADGINGLYVALTVEYNGNLEELKLAEKVNIVVKAVEVFNKFYFLFAENSKTLIELSGNVNNGINQALVHITDVLPMLEGLDVDSELAELKSHLATCYVDTFDECSFTTLELAGNTARNVNELVKAVNMLGDIVTKINASLMPLAYDNENMTTPVIFNEDEETGIL